MDAWILVVLVAGLAATGLVLATTSPRVVAWDPPVWLVAGLFFGTGSYVATVRVGRQAHVLQLDAVPRLLGLYLLGPAALVAARLVGTALALVVVRRQRGRKLVFNLSSFALETAVAVGVFHALDPGGIGPRTWAAAFLATLAADLVSAWTVGVVIALAEGRPVRGAFQLDRLAVGTALGAGAVGVVAATTLWYAPSSIALLAVLVGLGALAQRAVTRLEADRREQRDVQRLLQVLSAMEPDASSSGRALDAVRELLEVEAVHWRTDAQPDPHWTTSRAPDSSVDTPQHELDGLWERAASAAAEVAPEGGAPAVVVVVHDNEVRRAWRWTATAAVRHVAARVPAPAGAGRAEAGAADEGGASLLVATQPLHGSRVEETLVRVTRTAAEMVAQAATRVEQRRRLVLAASRDPLTGLHTLPEYQRRVQAQLDAGTHLAVLMLNLRRLRAVNDVFGREAGDQLIATAAARAQDLLPQAVLGRVSGHHLACAVELDEAGPALRLARRLRSVLEQPVAGATARPAVGVHIGISLSGTHGGDVEQLLRRAETAGDAAKDEPFGVAVFTPEQEQDVERPLRLVADLRAALALPGQLRLVYQPKLDLRTDVVLGCEALLRWDHPELGAVAPDEFIGLAESAGMITQLTDWTLERALHDAVRWRARGLPGRVAVNLSPRNLLDPGLVERVAAALDRHDTAADQLLLEITETSVMAQPLRSTLLLDALRDLGVALSIDDFGTGYSNLTYLQHLPVREVKLDRSFVQISADAHPAGGGSTRRRTFLHHAVGLVHALGLHVVAEGVEDEETLRLLREVGADAVQGYHVCRPLPPDEYRGWLEDRQREKAPA